LLANVSFAPPFTLAARSLMLTMPCFFASSAFIASEYVLFALEGLSHTSPFAASSSLTFAYVSAGDSRSLILL
jgi:hypothetical protein